MNIQSVTMVTGFLEMANVLPKDIKSKLMKALWLLAENFRHPSLQCKKVQGSRAELYECRVDQGIRLIYDISGSSVRCWYVGEHDRALRYAERAEPNRSAVAVDDVELIEAHEPVSLITAFLNQGVEPAACSTVGLSELAASLDCR